MKDLFAMYLFIMQNKAVSKGNSMFDKFRRMLGLGVILFIVSHFAVGTNVHAQSLPRPEFTISGNLVPATEFDNPPLSTLNSHASTVQTIDFTAEFSYPIVLNYGKTIWFLAGSYGQKILDHDNWPKDVSNEPNQITSNIPVSGFFPDDFPILESYSLFGTANSLNPKPRFSDF